jgi:hypothetical protein
MVIAKLGEEYEAGRSSLRNILQPPITSCLLKAKGKAIPATDREGT